MKTTILTLIASAVVALSCYAQDAPNFVKVGGTYVLTAAPGVTVPHLVTIAASGGGGWFRITEPKDSAPATGPKRSEDMGDTWINFHQLIMIREALPKKGPGK